MTGGAVCSVAGALRGTLHRTSVHVLGLDYDGTLAPFQLHRMEAHPHPGVLPLLERISSRGDPIAFFTGRPVAELRSILGSLGERCPIFGSHGGEEGWPQCPPENLPLPLWAREGLAKGEACLRIWWEREHPSRACPLEQKHGALALHVRDIPDQSTLHPIVQQWQALAHREKLRFTVFDGGWELRYPGFHKGNALRRFAALFPGAFVTYLGDDRTDEDAFAALETRGLGILVRPRWRPTRAAAWCSSPEELLAFLALWGADLRKEAR